MRSLFFLALLVGAFAQDKVAVDFYSESL